MVFHIIQEPNVWLIVYANNHSDEEGVLIYIKDQLSCEIIEVH